MLRQTKENDTVMLFVSGHGVNEGPDYQFVPTDAAWGSETLLQQSSVVPWHAFAEALTGANGRRIVFLDTCHAGNAFNGDSSATATRPTSHSIPPRAGIRRRRRTARSAAGTGCSPTRWWRA